MSSVVHEVVIIMSGPINVNVKRHNGKLSNIILRKEDPVDKLYGEFSKKTGMKVDQYHLIYTKYRLIRGEGKTLNDYGINKDSTVHQVMRMRGGSDVIQPRFKIVFKGEDIITLECDETVPKVKMPCGHVISPESMIDYCQHELDEGKSSFLCPGDGCEEEYPYDVVRQAAGLSAQDQHEFESKMAVNTCRRSQDIRQCPKCESYSMRDSESNPRVVCYICSENQSEYEFCWDCLTEWGNKNHSNCKKEFALDYLRNCGKKTIEKVANCPDGRACPKCYTLIEHISGCKHMKCPNADCPCSFCFVCLKQRVGTSWQCGSYNDVCEVAPVQDLSSN